MHLKSLTLKGFKSFAQSTTFAFEPGVTCVVGPNGSGKSNVVDALAWVMGEQGAKTLRGGKMDDVIFAGTATRGPLGRAEVLLTIDNSDGALPIEYSEVTISRTLFRNGGSEYAINGESCRLLDVQELLSDSGLGREMHVIVGQGQLDQVLHASPEERRGFIEEAAGILKHRRRKDKTVRKLEAMEANFTRLNDLAGELRRQLKPLGRQAEIAREAVTIQAVARDARARLLADDVVTLRTQLSHVGRDEGERKAERLVIQEQLDQARLRQGRLERAQETDAVDAARRTAFSLEQVQDRLRSLHALASQRRALLAEQEAPSGLVTVSAGMIEDARDEAGRLAEFIVTAEMELGRETAAVATAAASLEALDVEIAEQSALVSQHDLDAGRLEGVVAAAQSRLAATRTELERQRAALASADARREAARRELLEVESVGGAGGGDLDGVSLAAAIDAADDLLAERTEALEAIRDELHAAERQRDSLAARAAALTSALDGRDGTAALVDAALPGLLGRVSDHVTVAEGHEAAIAAALGSLADALLAESATAARAAVAFAREHDLGRVEVVIAAGPGIEAPATTGGVLVHVIDAPTGVRALLAGFDSAGDGSVESHLVIRGGTGATRSRLELLAERDSATDRLVEATTAIERATGARAVQRELVEQARSALSAAQQALRDFDARLAERSEALGRSRSQLEASTAEAERLGQAVLSLDASVESALAAVAAAVADRDAHAATPRPMLDVSHRASLLAELEGARGREMQARIALETARERVRAQQRQAEALQQQLDSERAAAEEAARRADIRERQRAAAERVIEVLPPVIEVADRAVGEARMRLVAVEAERSQQTEELAELRRGESQLRERLSALSETVHGLELQAYEKKLHLSNLLERAADELGLDGDVLVAEYGPDVPIAADVAPLDAWHSQESAGQSSVAEDADATSASSASDAPDKATRVFDRRQQQQRLQRAERQLVELGRVNPLALEEFAALEERHRFLTEQLTDLQNTRRDLRQIIGELDDKMQDIFLSAFEDTRAAFDQVFPVLFPGGSGQLQLTDPDSLLLTGIEVTVRPAGKKIERLSLLSGGERSLAAVALLIAIFKARPSPFYIMDEVEAALDDANLGRLLTVIEELRASSQLIIVTHQKRTMEIADALYGVSMRQDGVSAVVGQRVAVEERVN